MTTQYLKMCHPVLSSDRRGTMSALQDGQTNRFLLRVPSFWPSLVFFTFTSYFVS